MLSKATTTHGQWGVEDAMRGPGCPVPKDRGTPRSPAVSCHPISEDPVVQGPARPARHNPTSESGLSILDMCRIETGIVGAGGSVVAGEAWNASVRAALYCNRNLYVNYTPIRSGCQTKSFAKANLCLSRPFLQRFILRRSILV